MWNEQHKSGKINFVERYKDPYTDKWRRVSVLMEKDTPRTRKEAQKILNQKIGEILKTVNQSDYNFGDIYQEWFSYYRVRVKRTSWIKVGPMMRHINRHIKNDMLIRKIDERLVHKIIDDLYTFGNHSLNYTKQVRTTLSLIMGYAVEKKYITTNPVLTVKITPKKVEEELKRKTIDQKFLEREEVETVLDHLYKNPRRLLHARISELLYLTGMRYGELQALQVKDYNQGTISVSGTLDYTSTKMTKAIKTTPKNMTSLRTIDLPEKAKKILDDIIMENQLSIPNYAPDSYIFLSSFLTPLTIHSYNSILHQVEKELGLDKHLTSHIFRHSHISLLAELNTPLKVIMDRVGHADADTTLSVYNHVTKTAKSNLIDKLNQL